MVESVKPLAFRGSALDDLRVWQGVREIRISDEDGAFRVIYVAKFAEAVFVLHCFQKKSRRTARADVALATRRYSDLVRELKP